MMEQFYEMGKTAALQKLGQGGLLRSIGRAAKGTWEGMTPAAQGIAKRMGAGGAVGGVGGALAGGEEHRGGGALLGALGGSLGGAALGRALEGQATKGLAEKLWQQGTTTAAGNPRRAASALKQLEKLKPAYAEGEAALQRQVLPGLV